MRRGQTLKSYILQREVYALSYCILIRRLIDTQNGLSLAALT